LHPIQKWQNADIVLSNIAARKYFIITISKAYFSMVVQ